MNSDASNDTPRKIIKLSGSFSKHREILDAAEAIEFLQHELAAEQHTPGEWADHVSQAPISEIRAFVALLPGAPNLESDIKRIEYALKEGEALRSKAETIERAAFSRFAETIAHEWSEKEIAKAFKAQRNAALLARVKGGAL